MGYLLQILLAVAAQGAGEAGLGRADLSPLWGLALLPLPYLLARGMRRASLAGRFRSAGRRARILSLCAPLSFGAFVLSTGWIEHLRRWTGAELATFSWPELSLVLAFAPYVVLQAAAIDADSRAQEPRPLERRRLRGFQLRLFASGLVPILLYVLVSALVARVPTWRENIEQVALYHAVFVSILLTLLALCLPTLLANTWRTEPLPAGPQRQMLDSVAREASFRTRDVLVWRTGNTVANAAIVGFGRRRVVLFSDSLLSILSLRELAAVYGHEIGHSVRHHVAVFLTWALAFFAAGDLLAEWLAPQNEWLGTAILVGTLSLWALGFGWLSRRCELEADLHSLELLEDPEAMISALERVGGRLRDVAGWRHFSTRDRVNFLLRAWRDRSFADRFRRRLRRMAWLGAVLCLVGGALEVARFVERYPQDRFRADLVLGRYDAALSRVGEGTDFDPELLALGRLGSEVVGTHGPEGAEAELVRALASAIDGGRMERAVGCASLLYLRGHAELLGVIDTLDALTAVERDLRVARRALEDASEPWRARLAPWVERVGDRAAEEEQDGAAGEGR